LLRTRRASILLDPRLSRKSPLFGQKSLFYKQLYKYVCMHERS